MKFRLNLQLHVHTSRSFDCQVKAKEYVRFLEKNSGEDEFNVLGITDHNITPYSLKEAYDLSTKKVLVIPGLQWRLKKTLKESITKLSTRREILTLGDHDDLRAYIYKETDSKINEIGEILNNFSEDRLLSYLSGGQEIILIVPHPKHGVIEYYGQREIKELKGKMLERKINIPFFVEEKTGYDPLPRIFSNYKKKYLILGGSDAHEIVSLFKTNSMFSVETYLYINEELPKMWQKALAVKNLDLYRETLRFLFSLLVEKNKDIIIKKHYLRSVIHFSRSLVYFLSRRFEDFPRNFFK